jgi:y4mF family transcriptional regulator
MNPYVDIPQESPYGDIMHARTARDLGSVIKGTRRGRGWTQAELAGAAGVTRAWVIAIEQGKQSAELGLVLRALAALDLVADIVPAEAVHGGVDLDELRDDGG